MAGHLVRNLEQANQDVPKELMTLAMKSSWFKNSRFRKSGKGGGFGAKIGLGYKDTDRPGLGSGQSSTQEDSLNNYLSSKESTSAPGVVGGGRASALKTAFKSQYMSRFCKSADSGANSTNTMSAEQQVPTSVTNTISATDLMQNIQMPPPPPPTFPAYSNTSNSSNSSGNTSSETSGSSSSSTRKRKSRWE